MNSISRPSLSGYRQLLIDCANDYVQARTSARKARILSSLSQIESAALAYAQCADQGALAKLAKHSHCGVAEKDDLLDLYNTKFVPEGRPGRSLYMAIRQSAPKNRCPLCSQLPVSTIDHYLPKAKFPAYSLLPLNMVPSCERCNDYKSEESDALTLHPYYDSLEALPWLQCTLFDGEAVAISFGVMNSVEPSSLRQRMINHLHHVGVGELYQASALSHLADIRHRLCVLGSTGGDSAVQAYLIEEHESRQVRRLNSWATALYSALKSTDWFIRGGYRRIEHG